MTSVAPTKDRLLDLLVLGAAGRTGHEVVSQALSAGHHVTAFVRDGSTVVGGPGLSVVAGDALVPADLRTAVAGRNAVIDTIGSHRWTDDFLSETTGALVEAMEACGVRRVVLMSHFAVAPEYRPGALERLRHPFRRSFVADAARAEELVRSSGLAWTIVRATRLHNGPATGHLRVVAAGEPIGAHDSVARADVAAFLLRVVADGAPIHRTFLVTGSC